MLEPVLSIKVHTAILIRTHIIKHINKCAEIKQISIVEIKQNNIISIVILLINGIRNIYVIYNVVYLKKSVFYLTSNHTSMCINH